MKLNPAAMDEVFNGFDKTMFSFLRFVSGCGPSTTRWVLANEHSVVPVQAHWARLTARWWRRVMRNPGWLAHKAMKESILLSRGHANGVVGSDARYWYTRFASCMSDLGLGVSSASPEAAAGDTFTESSVVAALRVLHSRVWLPFHGINPRDVHGPGTTLCKYLNWVYDGTFGAHVLHQKRRTRTFAPHIRSTAITPGPSRVLAQLRAGRWRLAVNAGRAEHVDRSERLCTFCYANGVRCVEDELHVVCECPRYADLRARFSSIFGSGDTDMKVVLNNPDQCRVAAFAHAVHHRRFVVAA